MEEELHLFSRAIYYSELDITKAYHQISLSDRAHPYTALNTYKGLMEFTRLPFGMVTACATYIRLMRMVLAGVSNVSFYFDNILVYSKDWPSHIRHISNVLERLSIHGLTFNPGKCKIGFK